MILLISQLDTALNVVDKASAASDRWLFLGLLIAVLIGGVIVVKYLVNSTAVKDSEHAKERLALAAEVKSEREQAKADNRAERATAQAERKADQVEFLRMVESLKAEIKLMGENLAKNTETLQKHDTDMRTAHAVDIAEIVKKQLEKLSEAAKAR